MYNRNPGKNERHRTGIPYVNQSVNNIIKAMEDESNDHSLGQSIYFGPTALTHIRRIIESGGAIITDTVLVANDIDRRYLGNNGVRVMCFIDDPQVVSLAVQKQITRAEVAVDYGLAVPGLKLMVVGSAPAAINRMILRRQREPMNDVCVLAAPTGFASVVQIKERLIDSDLSSIVIRGKKGGIPAVKSLLNAILREIAEG